MPDLSDAGPRSAAAVLAHARRYERRWPRVQVLESDEPWLLGAPHLWALFVRVFPGDGRDRRDDRQGAGCLDTAVAGRCSRVARAVRDGALGRGAPLAARRRSAPRAPRRARAARGRDLQRAVLTGGQPAAFSASVT